MELAEAIKNQTTRLLESEQFPAKVPDTEIKDLLQAFLSLVTAYLSRVDVPEMRSGIVSPMDIKRANTYTSTFATDN